MNTHYYQNRINRTGSELILHYLTYLCGVFPVKKMEQKIN